MKATKRKIGPASVRKAESKPIPKPVAKKPVPKKTVKPVAKKPTPAPPALAIEPLSFDVATRTGPGRLRKKAASNHISRYGGFAQSPLRVKAAGLIERLGPLSVGGLALMLQTDAVSHRKTLASLALVLLAPWFTLAKTDPGDPGRDSKFALTASGRDALADAERAATDADTEADKKRRLRNMNLFRDTSATTTPQRIPKLLDGSTQMLECGQSGLPPSSRY
jgi:hypothetical protein